MNQTVTTLVPGGLALAQTLGYTAASAVVDNYTSNYVTLTDVGKVIPPWTYGAVVALPDGLRQANASLTPTVPAVAGPPVTTIQCLITWTDQVLPADPGHILQQSAYTQQTIIGTASAAAGGSSGTKNFAVPAGTASIGFDVNSGNIPTSVPSVITITGHQTGTVYVSTGGAGKGLNSGGPQWVAFDGNDTSVDCAITALGGGAGAIVDFLASPLAMAVSLPFVITVQTTSPALWQAAQASASLTEAATGTFTLVAAVAGQQIRVFGWSLAADGTGTSGSRSHIIPHGGSGTAIAWLSGAGGGGGVGAEAGEAGGVLLPVNTALDFVVDFLAAGNTALVAVTYSQG